MFETVAILRRFEDDLAIVARCKVRVSIKAERGVHHEATVVVAERRQIRSTAREAEPKRRSRSNTGHLLGRGISHDLLALRDASWVGGLPNL